MKQIQSVGLMYNVLCVTLSTLQKYASLQHYNPSRLILLSVLEDLERDPDSLSVDPAHVLIVTCMCV